MIEVDVRVIAATNKDLEREMEAGRFRQDLFYRLNVIPLRVPPLRERKEDIPLLVDRFLREFAEKEGEPVKTMTPDALEILMQHDWPGNVRELKNLIERLAILVPSPVIDAQDIPSFSITPNETDSSVTLDVAGSLREAKWNSNGSLSSKNYGKTIGTFPERPRSSDWSAATSIGRSEVMGSK